MSRRIRSIKPEFFDSPSTAKCSPWARLFFIAMWNMADDWGIGQANMKEMAGFAFPNDDQWTSKELPSLCKEVANNYGVMFYINKERPYYWIPSWEDHQVTQRRAKRRYPTHDDPESAPDLRFHPENVTNKELPCNYKENTSWEQGNRGTGEQGNRGTSEIAKAIPRHDVTQILDHLDQRLKANGVKIPNRTQKNLDAARLLIDRDKRTVEQIIAAIDYATNNEFWRTNILSMSKLREKYDQLRLQASRTPGNSGTPPPNRVQQNMAVVARMAAQADQPRKEITQ